jgi:tRNA nucleotidyltransferase/poly(A) polymerase
MEMYTVGGCVRDEILGVKSKDIDYSVVLSPDDFPKVGNVVEMPTAFDVMRNKLIQMGFKIFLETPEYFTIRAQFPKEKTGIAGVIENSGLTADFVLARKESGYTDGRRPDSVQIGTLRDDLKRRDFTMNAIAKDAEGNLIDPFGGVKDINDGIISAVGSAQDRLEEDALRAVRALRFSVTKGFIIDPDLRFAMNTATVLTSIKHKISDERIKDELSKMFRFDTRKSLDALATFPALTTAMFSGSVSLDATMKIKGRGRA